MREQATRGLWVLDGNGLRAAEEQSEVAALHVGERGRIVRQDLEAEVRRVEGDRRLDVVDHVPDVNRADGHGGHVTEQARGAVSRPR